MEKQERTWMYLLNIVACFAVIVLHCCTPAFFSYREGIRWDIANVLQQVFKFAVPCFFMMSGANLLGYYKRYSTKEFYKKRLLRVAVPFVIWSIILYIYSVVKKGIKTDEWNFSIYNFVYLFMNNKINNVYWFFYSIIGLYLLTPVIKEIVKNEKVTKWFLILSFVYLTINPILVNSGIGNYFQLPIISKYLFYYILGYYLLNMTERIYNTTNNIISTSVTTDSEKSKVESKFSENRKKRQLLFITIIGLLSLIALIVLNYCNLYYNNKIVSVLMKTELFGILYYVMIYILFSKIKISNKRVVKILKDISGLSLGIYLIHQPILNIVISIFNLDIYSKVLYFIVPVFLYIFCSLITFIIKKIPYLKLIMP